ncbi:MAG: iron chelate uptake ABC transporter family permease subunit [Pseudomonadota bacterium]
MILLVLAALASATAFMTVGAQGSWSFVLPFRGEKLAALVLVAVAVSTSTMLFQTITFNRILTPAIMGFDALYVLLMTGAVFFFGGQGLLQLPPMLVFLITSAALIVAALALFGTLLGRGQGDLLRMILTGIIFGVLFRSLTSFMQRVIDPNEFSVIQVVSYARFNTIETDILYVALPVTLVTLSLVWVLRRRLDVIALGSEVAINLGEVPALLQLQVLALIAVLVSVATAFVGPVVFFGLLVASLTHVLLPTPYHRVLLPAAALISITVLVGGQTILERALGLTTPLAVVIDVIGGALFLILVLRGLRR